MDPTSQGNSFGSFGPGGNNPGVSGGVPGNNAMNAGSVPAASGPAPTSGAPVNGSMTSNGLGQMGQVGQSSQTNQMWQASQMNQMGMSSAVVSSDSGDVVIGESGGNNGKKKWFIFGGVASLIILVVIGVAIFFLNNPLINVKEVFLNYKDVVLYDNDKESYPTEKGDYAIEVAINNMEKENLIRYYGSVEDLSSSLLRSLGDDNLKQQISYILLWVFVSEFYHYDDDSLVDVYEKQGEKSALDYINNKYKIVSGNEMMDGYVSKLLAAEQDYLNYIMAFESNGCKISEEGRLAEIYGKDSEELDLCEGRGTQVEVETDYLMNAHNSVTSVFLDMRKELRKKIQAIMEVEL